MGGLEPYYRDVGELIVIVLLNISHSTGALIAGAAVEI